MRPQAKRFNHADNGRDLGLGGIGIHYDKHGGTLSYAIAVLASRADPNALRVKSEPLRWIRAMLSIWFG